MVTSFQGLSTVFPEQARNVSDSLSSVLLKLFVSSHMKSHDCWHHLVLPNTDGSTVCGPGLQAVPANN